MKLLQLLLLLQNNNQRLLQVLKLRAPPNLSLQVQVQLLPRMCLALPRLTPFRSPKANHLQPAWHGSLRQ